jgi:hypothetical protein
MNAAAAVPAGQGREPDPVAAQAMADEARRLHVAGRGGILIGLGVYAIFFGLLFLAQPGLAEKGPSNAWCWTLLVGAALCMAVWLWAARRARRMAIAAGEPLPSDLYMNAGPASKLLVWLVAVAVAVAAIALVVPWGDIFFMAVCFVVQVLGLLIEARRLRLWPLAATGAGYVAGAAIVAWGGESMIGWASLTFGAGFLAGGISLRMRWRRWVASLPKNGLSARSEGRQA